MALPLKAPTFVVYPDQDIYQAAADKLGKVQAQLAPLKNEEEAVKEILRGSGLDVVEGRDYRVTISHGKDTESIDWEALARSVCSESRLARLIPSFSTIKPAGKARVAAKARKGV
jgi:hypothetical protein